MARREFEEQASANELAGDEPVAFHGRSHEAVREHGEFGRQYEAPEGSAGVPEQFQSPELSNLRLTQAGGSGISIPRVGLPKPRTRSSGSWPSEASTWAWRKAG